MYVFVFLTLCVYVCVDFLFGLSTLLYLNYFPVLYISLSNLIDTYLNKHYYLETSYTIIFS